MHFKDHDSKQVEFIVHLKIKNLSKEEEKKYFSVPVFVTLNENDVEIYPTVLDFGILYANSGITHKIQIKARGNGRDQILVGFPFVPINSFFEFDFRLLVLNQGNAFPHTNYSVGFVTLKTQGILEGEYAGSIIF